MRLSQLKDRKWNYNAIAFAIPFIGMLVVMLVNGCRPFGTSSMLYSDMYHQYFPFFKAFRAALLSGDSLLYNWDVGLGLDYVGLYSYYLASPLNLLSILVPEQWLLGYFSLLVPIKLGLASLFFSIFLQKTFGKYDISIPLFGSFYGLCAWALGYQWNVMWLDTFALLPLVITGMMGLLKEKKFVLYTLTLFLSVLINYYVGLFTCIFVLLVFICYQICRWKNFSTFFKDLGRIAFFSALAIAMTAILSLPTLAALQTTQSSVNKFPTKFYLNIASEHNWKGLLKAMVQVAGNTSGGINPTFKEGLPNLYCGVLTTILSVLYLFCKQVRLRDKICAVFLLLFFNVSFIIRYLDYIWHGFHFPNMIPHRFSFLYSFVMLYMAYSAWVNRKKFRLWQIIVSSVAAIAITLCYKDWSDRVYWAYNGLLLLLYIFILVSQRAFRLPSEDKEEQKLYIKKFVARRRLSSTLLLGIMAMEIVMNLVNFAMTFTFTNTANYPKGGSATASVLEYMEELEADTPFYRTETTHAQILNDGALNRYHGISAFTSSANVKVTEFMKTLGYGAKNTYNRYCFEESSPVANLFLGLKYMIERDGKVEDNPYFDDIYSVDDVHLLKNNAYLPLGFLANSQLLNVDFSSDGYRFSFQNQLMKNAAGLDKDVWFTLTGSSLTITGDAPTLAPQPNTGYCSYTAGEEDCTITYSYTATKEGLMCVNIDQSKRNAFTLLLNGTELYNETYSIPQMLSVSNVKIGDVVDVQFTCKKKDEGTIKVSAAILNEEIFRQGYNTLAESVLELTIFSNTLLEGTIDCNRDGVLYTSIPQNGNWHAFVDGNPVDIVTIGDAMVGLLLTRGTHTIRFEYHNPAFSLGWKISAICLIAFAGIYLTAYKPSFRRKKGKYQK